VNRQPTGTGLRRAGCGGTRTSGSEVRAGETGRPKGRHRAPVRPYTFAWLGKCRRLAVDYERKPEHHQAWVQWAMVRLMVKRPTQQAPPLITRALSPAA
jgi:hypothetical protein